MGFFMDGLDAEGYDRKYSDAQREIYQLVLDAQMAGIRMSKPGNSLNQVHGAASRVLRAGLVKLGILPKEMGNRRNAMRNPDRRLLVHPLALAAAAALIAGCATPPPAGSIMASETRPDHYETPPVQIPDQRRCRPAPSS